MKISRTDLVPVLAIVAGGMIGASLSVSLLGPRSHDVVFVAVRVVAPDNVEARRLEEQKAIAEAYYVFASRKLASDKVAEEGQRVLDRVQEVLLRRDEALLQRDIEAGRQELMSRLEELQGLPPIGGLFRERRAEIGDGNP